MLEIDISNRLVIPVIEEGEFTIQYPEIITSLAVVVWKAGGFVLISKVCHSYWVGWQVWEYPYTCIKVLSLSVNAYNVLVYEWIYSTCTFYLATFSIIAHQSYDPFYPYFEKIHVNCLFIKIVHWSKTKFYLEFFLITVKHKW